MEVIIGLGTGHFNWMCSRIHSRIGSEFKYEFNLKGVA